MFFVLFEINFRHIEGRHFWRIIVQNCMSCNRPWRRRMHARNFSNSRTNTQPRARPQMAHDVPVDRRPQKQNEGCKTINLIRTYILFSYLSELLFKMADDGTINLLPLFVTVQIICRCLNGIR